jgi:hypothetical protein
MSLLTVGL